MTCKAPLVAVPAPLWPHAGSAPASPLNSPEPPRLAGPLWLCSERDCAPAVSSLECAFPFPTSSVIGCPTDVFSAFRSQLQDTSSGILPSFPLRSSLGWIPVFLSLAQFAVAWSSGRWPRQRVVLSSAPHLAPEPPQALNAAIHSYTFSVRVPGRGPQVEGDIFLPWMGWVWLLVGGGEGRGGLCPSSGLTSVLGLLRASALTARRPGTGRCRGRCWSSSTSWMGFSPTPRSR